MRNARLEKDAIIYNAWQSFVKNGQIKSSVIGDALAVKWERYKLLGVNPQSPIENLTQDYEHGARGFFAELAKNDMQLPLFHTLVVNRAMTVQDVFQQEDDLNGIKPRDVLAEVATGNLSLYKAKQDNQIAYLIGARHYKSQLHRFVDITVPFILKDEQYYLVSFVPLLDFDEYIVNKITNLLNVWLNSWQVEYKAQLNKTLSERALITIDNNGEIIASNDLKTYKMGSNIEIILRFFDYDKIRNTGITYSVEMKSGKAVSCLLLNSSVDGLTIAIADTKLFTSSYQNVDIFRAKSKVVDDSNDVDRRLKQLSRQPHPILLLGNDHGKLSETIYDLITLTSIAMPCFVVDAAIIGFDSAENYIKWFADFDNCHIVFSHIECVKKSAQHQLLGMILENKAHLAEKNVRIIITGQFYGAGDHRISERVKKTLEMTTYHCIKIEHNNAINQKNQQMSEEIPLLSLKEMEIRTIQKTLQMTDWNISKSAKILGIGRTTLHRKIKQNNIKIEDVSY